MNLVSTELTNIEGFRIVEREALDTILERYGIELSAVPDKEQTDMGKLLGAELICLGRVTDKLTFARVVLIETGEVLVAGSDKNVRKFARKLRNGLLNTKVIDKLNRTGEKNNEKISLPLDVEVKGYGYIVDGDVIAARKQALRDAFVNAIRKGCGIRILKHMEVEKHVAVSNMILTESVGYVNSYKVLDENPNSEFGYEVSVHASVIRQPISNLEELKLVVKYLHADSRIIVFIDGSVEGKDLGKSYANEIARRVGAKLKDAGFLVVDPETIEERKMGIAYSSSDGDAARLGDLLDADLVVRGTLTSKITDRIEEINGEGLQFPIVSAITTGVFRIIRPQTAEIISSFSHEDLPLDREKETKGFGNTDDEAIASSINGFISISSEKLAWELASKLGEPIQMHEKGYGRKNDIQFPANDSIRHSDRVRNIVNISGIQEFP